MRYRQLIRFGLSLAAVLIFFSFASTSGELYALAPHGQTGVHAQGERDPDPTPTPEIAAPSPALSRVQIGSRPLAKVVGHRQSPVLYGLTDDGALFRSGDNGDTWELMAEWAPVDDFIISAANPMVLYRGRGLACDGTDVKTQPFYRSRNGGVTWTRLPMGDNLTPLLAHPRDAATLLAADCEMLYLSVDGGERWQPKQDLSSTDLWTRYRVEQVAAATKTGKTRAGDPPLDEAGWGHLYAGGSDGDGSSVVAHSGDMGEGWARITPRLNPEPVGLSAMAADPDEAGRLWFADEHGIWQTADFGRSWLLTPFGPKATSEREAESAVTALTVGADGTLYVGTTSGPYQGDGTGGDWTRVGDETAQTIKVQYLLLTDDPNALWINAAGGVYRAEIGKSP